MKSEEERLVADQESSGLSISEFCRRRGLPASRLYGMRKRRMARSRREPGQFVRVGIGAIIEVEVSTGLKLRVPLESLRSVLRELGAELCER